MKRLLAVLVFMVLLCVLPAFAEADASLTGTQVNCEITE